MRIKRGLSLILSGIMLISTVSFTAFAGEDADASTDSYTGPQKIYYYDFEGIGEGELTAFPTGAGMRTVNTIGTNANLTLINDEENNNTYLNVTHLSGNFQTLISATSTVANAKKYVVEYKVRPNLGSKGVFISRKGGEYGVPHAGFYRSVIYPERFNGTQIGSYSDDNWYTVTVVYDGDHKIVDGKKYVVRDIYINGEKSADGTGIEEEAPVRNSGAGTLESDFLDVDGETKTSAPISTTLWIYTAGSYDLDYMRYYASADTFAAKLPNAAGTEVSSLDIWFNNIPVKSELLSKISVVDKAGNTVAGISSAALNNEFNPGADNYAQSYKLTFDTALDPGKSYKLKIDGLTDFAENTLSSELDFSTKALKVYADNFKLMSGSEEVTTLADGTYSISFSFTNETSEEVTPVIAAALYDADGILKGLSLKEAEPIGTVDSETYEVTDVTLSGTSGGKLKIFALKSATDWSPVSAVAIVDGSGTAAESEFDPELATYEEAFETESTIDGDTMAITTKVKEWDVAMSGRQALLLTLKEGKAFSDISLASPLETIVAIDTAPAEESGIVYNIPDAKGIYPALLFLSNSDTSGNGSIEYFGKAYIDAGLEIVKDITAGEVAGFLTDYEKALSIDLSGYNGLGTKGKDAFAASIEALRNEKETKLFAGFEDLYTAMAEALVFALVADGDDLGEVIDDKLKEEKIYDLWKNTVSDAAFDAAFDKVKEDKPLTYKELTESFEKAVVLCGIENAVNYSQVLTILKEMYEEIDIEDISEYSNSIQKTVATNIAGKSYDDYEALGAAFEVFLNAAKKGGSSGGSSGGGSGGGGSSKPGSTGNYGSVTMGSVAPAEKAEENKPADPSKFNDLSGFDWAKESIYALAEKGIISGKSETSYAPADLITRAELTKLVVAMYDMAKESGEPAFKDVSADDWFAEYVNAAVKNGIINGTGEGNFSPNMNVTREMAAVIIYRAALKNGKAFESSKNEFGDKDEISDYAVDAISYLSGASILNGDEAGKVNPKAALTRAEAAVLLSNLLKI